MPTPSKVKLSDGIGRKSPLPKMAGFCYGDRILRRTIQESLQCICPS